jgi:hypothetical protein
MNGAASTFRTGAGADLPGLRDDAQTSAGDRKKVFEKKDFITFFLAPGMALICAVLSLGRLDWWFEAPWIGWSLALAVVLIVSAIVFEHNRSNPCSIRAGSPAAALCAWFDHAVNPYRAGRANTGVFGWLQYVGLQNEQMTNLAWSILAGLSAALSPVV